MLRTLTVAALAASASAFVAIPATGRVTGAPALRMANDNMGKNYGPVITIFDNRGCNNHTPKEYNGPKTGAADPEKNDEMLVKVANNKIPFPTDEAVNNIRREQLGQLGNLDYLAPDITVFDHRGCSRAPKEYKGKPAGGSDDEMMVKVAFSEVKFNTKLAQSVLDQTISVLSPTPK